MLRTGRCVPITYEIDVPSALIGTQCIGDVTLADVQAHFRELPSVWPPVDRLDVLLDLRDLTSLPTLEELGAAAKEIDEQIGLHRFGRCAVVAYQEPMRGAMYTFEALTERLFDGGLQVFRTAEGARMWLTSPPDHSPR